MEDQAGLHINKRTFFNTMAVLLAVMVAAGILTRVLPQGSYERVTSAAGYETVVAGTYTTTDADPLPIWRWFTAPFEVFTQSDSLTAIVIILFLIFMGGTFLIIEKSGVMRYIINAAIARFGSRKYLLMAVVSLICMLMGSVIGMFEETVALVPIMVAMALALGWDSFVGIGMSILSVGLGFAAGTFNAFTIGIAQDLAGLPLYSGLGLRAVVFVIVYAMLMLFLVSYAKKIERSPEKSPLYDSDSARREKFVYNDDPELLGNKKLKKATVIFLGSFVLIFVYVIAGMFVGGLSDYVLPVQLLLVTAGGIVAGAVSGYCQKGLLRDFLHGCVTILPGTLFIVLAMSAKQILVAGGIMDTVLHIADEAMSGVNAYGCALVIFAFVLVLELFISSASAKAFLIMPVIVPLADLIGLTRQSAVQAFVFGDGFTNMFFPTNALLLIALGMINVSYGKWWRWTWKLQLGLLLLSAATIVVSVAINYGPF